MQQYYKCDTCPGIFTDAQVIIKAQLRHAAVQHQVYDRRQQTVSYRGLPIYCPSCDKIHLNGFDVVNKGRPTT